jgi:hypothetical protein
VPSGSAPASGKATGPPPRPGPCIVMRHALLSYRRPR